MCNYPQEVDNFNVFNLQQFTILKLLKNTGEHALGPPKKLVSSAFAWPFIPTLIVWFQLLGYAPLPPFPPPPPPSPMKNSDYKSVNAPFTLQIGLGGRPLLLTLFRLGFLWFFSVWGVERGVERSCSFS